MSSDDANRIERLERVEAQLAIQQLAARYARAVDSRNLADLGELFASQTRFGDHGSGPEGAIIPSCKWPCLSPPCPARACCCAIPPPRRR